MREGKSITFELGTAVCETQWIMGGARVTPKMHVFTYMKAGTTALREGEILNSNVTAHLNALAESV